MEFAKYLNVICPREAFPKLYDQIVSYNPPVFPRRQETFQEHCLRVANIYRKNNTCALLKVKVKGQPLSFWIGFLHDVGKPFTATYTFKTKGHAAVGEFIATKLFSYCDDISSELIDFCVQFIGLHMCALRTPLVTNVQVLSGIMSVLLDKNDLRILEELQNADELGRKTDFRYGKGVGYSKAATSVLQKKPQVAIFLIGPKGCGKTTVANHLVKKLSMFTIRILSYSEAMLQRFGKLGENPDDCLERLAAENFNTRREWSEILKEAEKVTETILIVEDHLSFFKPLAGFFEDWFTVCKLCLPHKFVSREGGTMLNFWADHTRWEGLKGSRIECPGDYFTDVSFGNLKNLCSAVFKYLKQVKVYEGIMTMPRLDVVWNKMQLNPKEVLGTEVKELSYVNVRNFKFYAVNGIEGGVFDNLTRHTRGTFIMEKNGKFHTIVQGSPTLRATDADDIKDRYGENRFENITFGVTKWVSGIHFNMTIVPKGNALYADCFKILHQKRNIGYLTHVGLCFVGTEDSLELNVTLKNFFFECLQYEFDDVNAPNRTEEFIRSAEVDNLLAHIISVRVTQAHENNIITLHYKGFLKDKLRLQTPHTVPALQYVGLSMYGNYLERCDYTPNCETIYLNHEDLINYLNVMKSLAHIIYVFDSNRLIDACHYSPNGNVENDAHGVEMMYRFGRYVRDRERLSDRMVLMDIRESLLLIFCSRSEWDEYNFKKSLDAVKDRYDVLCSKYSITNKFDDMLHTCLKDSVNSSEHIDDMINEFRF